MRLAEWFQAYARGRGVTVANQLAVEIRKVLSVRAPIRVTKSGKLVAATRATPFAPPRLITGKLKRSVRVIRTANGASVQVYVKYAVPLEKGTKYAGFPHKFVALALQNLGLKGRNS